MPPPSTAALQVSEVSFDLQIKDTREALKVFKAIVALDALGPGKIAMSELVTTTVRTSFIFHFSFVILGMFR